MSASTPSFAPAVSKARALARSRKLLVASRSESSNSGPCASTMPFTRSSASYVTFERTEDEIWKGPGRSVPLKPEPIPYVYPRCSRSTCVRSDAKPPPPRRKFMTVAG